MKHRLIFLPAAFLFAAIFFFIAERTLDAKDFFVAVNGNDSWTGSLTEPNKDRTDGPFLTLDKAKAAVRAFKSTNEEVTVYIREGLYYIASTFTLGSEDSGTENAPVTWSAYPGEKVHLMAGRYVNNFTSVADTSIIKRLGTEAQKNVVQANLFDLGFTQFPEISQSKGPGMDIFFRSNAMTLARYPNNDFLKIVSVPLDCPEPILGDPRTKVYHCGKFVYNDTGKFPQYQVLRPKTWAASDDIWMMGYWCWDWAEMYQKVEKFDHEKYMVYLAPPYHYYGYVANQRYYFLNVLEELDSPGEWYLDNKTGILYFWPPSGIGENDVYISSMDKDMVKLDNASYITIKKILLEGTRQCAVVINGGKGNMVDGCEVRNVGGDYSVVVDGGTENGIQNCLIHDISGGGINIYGGDRKTLTPAGNYAHNNHIYSFARVYRTYHGGITIGGVGNRATHNEISNAPHSGMFFSGNEHIIEYNEIHDVAQETHDVGAIYNGRDYTQRGTIIRYNYIHDNPYAEAVYLDDFLSGEIVYGNVIYKNSLGILIGGGRDNIVDNNIFIENGANVHVDGRGLGWAAYYFNPADPLYPNDLIPKMEAMNYTQPPYSVKYPELLTLYSDEPAAPKYNVIKNNILWKGTNWSFGDNAQNYITRENNLEGTDPLFIDFSAKNFQLKENSPAYSKIGFVPVPFEKMGLIKDEATTGVKSIKPQSIRLDQNNPNPFNPSTTISFFLPASGNVKLTVHNILGQEVAKLVDGKISAGEHHVIFDGNDIATGMYLYRFVSGDFSMTKKMMLVK